MTELKFNICKRTDDDLIDLIEKHEGFSSKSEFVRYHIKKGIELEKQQKINSKKIIPSYQNPNNCLITTEDLQLISDVVNNVKDDRAVVRALRSHKIKETTIVNTFYAAQKVIKIFENTQELRSVIQMTKKEVSSKNTAKSSVVYNRLMKECPLVIERNMKRMEEEEKRYKPAILGYKLPKVDQEMKQSKIPQFPEPPRLSTEDNYSDDELEPYSEEEQQEPEEIDERDLIVR